MNNIKIKTKPSDVVESVKKCNEYKDKLGASGLFTQTRKNERFLAGDQWLGAQTKSNLPLISFNVIKRIVDYKTAQVLSNPLTAQFAFEGVADFIDDDKSISRDEIIKGLQNADASEYNKLENEEKVNLVASVMTKFYQTQTERLKFNSLLARALRKSAVSGTGAIYFYWDSSVKTGQKVGGVDIKGDVSAEVIDVVSALSVENPACEDIQGQDFIVITKKTTVAEAKRIAKQNGVAEEDIEQIKSDESTYYSSERDEQAKDMLERVTIYTKFYKNYEDNGEYSIYAVMCTANVIIKPDWDTGLSVYPIALISWEERSDSIFGESEVTSLIPNQIAINRMSTASVWSAMLNGMPILMIDESRVKGNITNKPGQVWKFNGDGDMRTSAYYLNPPQISSALVGNMQTLIDNTLTHTGANDAALGNMRSENAAAIIALQEAAHAPMQMLKNRTYQFAEDCARIFASFCLRFYDSRKLKITERDCSWYLPFDAKDFDSLVLSVKIDVGPSTVWSVEAQRKTLENLYQLQILDVIDYLERLDPGTVPRLPELIKKLKAKVREAEVKQKESESVENFDIDTFYNALSPEEKEQFDLLSHEEQKAIIEQEKARTIEQAMAQGVAPQAQGV